MAMDYRWDDETHITMRLDIGLDTTWDEYHEGMDRLVREMTAAEHRVYLILQIMGNIPPGNPLPHLKLGMGKLADLPNLGAVMVVGTHRVSAFGQKVIHLILSLYRRDLPPNGGNYDTVEEARAAILKLREREKLG